MIPEDMLCRYISAIERNPEDPDAYYNWALVLQVKLHSLFTVHTSSYIA
jgi:hypothetical protein